MDTIETLVAEYAAAVDKDEAAAKAYRILSNEGSRVAWTANPQAAREQARQQCRDDVAEYRRRIAEL